MLIALNGEATQSLEVEVEAFQQAQSKRLEAFQTLEVATSTTTQEVTTSNTTIRAQSPPTVESGSAVSTSNGSSTSNSSQKITHVVAEESFWAVLLNNTMWGSLSLWLERFNEESILAMVSDSQFIQTIELVPQAYLLHPQVLPRRRR